MVCRWRGDGGPRLHVSWEVNLDVIDRTVPLKPPSHSDEDRTTPRKITAQQGRGQVTHKDSSNAYTFVLAFSRKLEFRI